MARYGKIDVRLWGDLKFRALSPIPPCGAGLWVYLLAPRERLRIPGLIPAGQAALAESLRWPVEAFREAFGEVLVQGMAKADWSAPLVWVPNAIRYNEPESPNVVRGWRTEWDELPECALKDEAARALLAFLEAKGETFSKAFREACLKPSPQPSPNQEQEQEQEQEPSRRGPAAGKKPVTLGPLASEVVAAVSAGLGWALRPLRAQDEADELERRIAAFGGGAEEAIAYFAATCRRRHSKPEAVKLLLEMLRDLEPEVRRAARAGGGS